MKGGLDFDMTRSERDSSWCYLLINGSRVTAKVKHIGSGRYKILEDKENGKYFDMIIDASDIFHCNL